MKRLEKRPTTKITGYRRNKVFKRDNHTCKYCEKTEPEVRLEIDHKKPRILGGSNHLINLITSCSKCNNSKRDMSYKLFLNICQRNAI